MSNIYELNRLHKLTTAELLDESLKIMNNFDENLAKNMMKEFERRLKIENESLYKKIESYKNDRKERY